MAMGLFVDRCDVINPPIYRACRKYLCAGFFKRKLSFPYKGRENMDREVLSVKRINIKTDGVFCDIIIS